MKIKSFEDLECWKEARALSWTIYDYTKHLDFSKDFTLFKRPLHQTSLNG